MVVLAHLLKFFGLFYFILYCSFDKLHFSRSFRQFCYLARFRNFSFIWRYLVPRSVIGPSAVFVASTCCIPSIFYVRGIFFDFPRFRIFAVISPVFPLFVLLPRCFSRSRFSSVAASFLFRISRLSRGKIIVAA